MSIKLRNENSERIIVKVLQLESVYFYISVEETVATYAIKPFCFHMFQSSHGYLQVFLFIPLNLFTIETFKY